MVSAWVVEMTRTCRRWAPALTAVVLLACEPAPIAGLIRTPANAPASGPDATTPIDAGHAAGDGKGFWFHFRVAALDACST